MDKKLYVLYQKTIKLYLKLDNYRVVRLKHSEPQSSCSCKSVLTAEKGCILFPFSHKLLTFYVAKCDTCKIAYLYKTLEVEDSEDSD